jgi:Tol biopolymer transport system component
MKKKGHESLQILLIFIVFLLISPLTVWAQEFGKNKVTQQHFDWFIHKTEHFDIYYYPDESRLVSVMGDIAEDAYRKFSEDFGHELSERTPLILYKCHSDFQETNIILEELSEGVGGFAEFFKRRIVIPFTGSMTQFQAVIFHELTHIFQYDIIYQKPVAHIYTGEFLYSPPLWFIEGMAEYMSGPPAATLAAQAGNWDATDEMVLRNACVSNSIVPLTYLQDFDILGSQVFLGYKEGQSAIEYLVQTYGRDKLVNILQELKHNRTKSLDDAFKNTIGTDVQKFDKDWQHSIKRKYWPMIQYKKMPDEIATQLTGKKSESNNFKSVWSVSGDLIAYITSEYGYDEIRIISAKDGKLIDRISKGFYQDGYEDIRSEGSGIAWSPDGDKLAFIAKDKKKEYLFVLNIITRKIQHKIQLPFDVSYSPTWAPDNNRIAFAALKDGKTDIYLISLDKAARGQEGKRARGQEGKTARGQDGKRARRQDGKEARWQDIQQLTDDPFDDNHPSWHPVLDKIVYSSEREGKYKLFVFDLDSQTQIPPAPGFPPLGGQEGGFNKGGAMQLTHEQQNAVSPSWSRDGAQIIFCSDLNGIYDVYSMEPTPDPSKEGRYGNNFTRLTDIMTGCFNPSLSPDKRKILFSAYDDGRQNIFVMDMDKAVNEKIDMPPLNKEPVAITAAQNEEEHNLLLGRKKYSTSLVLDAIFTDFQYSADGLLQNTTQLIASDMMGNHRFGLSVAANQSGFLTPDFIASYFYLARRTDYGAAFFNYHEYYLTIDGYLLAQRNTGLLGFLSYPLDRYRRIELQTLIYSTPFDYKYYTDLDAPRGTIISSEIAYTKDTTMWNEFGPYAGTRYILDVEHSLPSLGSDLEMTNVILDSRKYFRLGKRTCLATRMLLGGSFGSDHALFYIGGIDTMRGYGYEDLAGTRVGLLNLELRIPFIDELRFGWPFAWSISGIRGILFTDFGTVWSKWQFGPENRYKALIRTGNKIQLVDVKNSVGIGLRLKLGSFDLNFDIAKRTNLTQFTDEKTRFHFGLGQEF